MCACVDVNYCEMSGLMGCKEEQDRKEKNSLVPNNYFLGKDKNDFKVVSLHSKINDNISDSKV